MSMRAANCPETSSRRSNSDAIRLKTHVNQKRRGEPSFLSLLYGSFHPSMAVSQLESRATCYLVIDHIFHLYKIKYMINNLYIHGVSQSHCSQIKRPSANIWSRLIRSMAWKRYNCVIVKTMTQFFT